MGTPPTDLEGGVGPQPGRFGGIAPTALVGGVPAPMGRTVLVDDPSRRLVGFLVVVRGRADVPYRDFPVYEGKNPVGQAAAGAHIALADPKVSREHATIMVQDGVCSVVDLGSANGVFLNGEKVLHNPLRHGDSLKFGGTTLAFVPVPY